MKRRLVKIAKELNVGLSTIVDFLNDKGFEIDAKPTAQVTEQMYSELLKEFQKSIAIKEQADQMVIGTRSSRKEDETAETSPIVTPTSPTAEKEVAKVDLTTPPKVDLKAAPKVDLSTPAPKVDLKTPPKVDLTTPPKVDLTTPPKVDLKTAPKVDLQPKKEEPKKEEPKKEVEASEPKQTPVAKETEAPKAKPALKILGKIDLASTQRKPSSKKAAPKKEAPKAEKPKVAAAPKKEQNLPAKEEKKQAPSKPSNTEKPTVDTKKEPAKQEQPTQKEAVSKKTTDEAQAPKAAAPTGEMIRSKTPELRGLKILGKIDTSKLGSKNKGRKDKKDADKNKQKQGASNAGDATRRRRKRKKITANSNTNDGNRQQSGNAGGGNTSNAGGQNRGGGGQNRGGQQRGNQRGGQRGNQRGGNPRNAQNRGRRQEEVKEVSQKEIEDKIKATMARMAGRGKKKRQKLRRDNRERIREKQELQEQERQTDKLQLTEFISVQELANLMDVAATDVIMTCMNLGVIVSINQRLDAEVIELVAEEFNHEVEFISVEEEQEEEEEVVDDPADLVSRAPVVTIMGHVDHGKTSLLDYIRSASVAEGEAGGITQHIGAYEVYVNGDKSKPVTFLDTPGHEAFTAMRARGAKVTDIAVIIIAADDSIMPQTREAISHAEAAGVPMIFAINKIDKPGANPDRIKQELASMNYLIEEWGGAYGSADISAKKGTNIDALLERIQLEAEVKELKANPKRSAVGTVIEASLDKGRGYVTKMLVQTGTLKIGDSMVSGEHSGRVKAMFNERNKRVKEAGPSTPVLVLGLGGAPQAGERFKVVDSEQEAREIANRRAQISREQANRATKRISLDEIGRRLALGNFKELNLIVKGDVDGSVEALSDSLIKLSQETVQVNVIHRAVGQIIESDVLLSTASDAIIIGFQVRPSAGARKLAEREGVQIKTYSIIYEVIDEIKKAIEGMLDTIKEENVLGQIEVREVFKISKVGTVAGCFVSEGKILRDNHVRLIRDGIVIYPTKEGQVGEINALKRFKDDVKEVRAGMECGLSVKNYNDIKVGDVIEAYEIVEIKQKLKS